MGRGAKKCRFDCEMV